MNLTLAKVISYVFQPLAMLFISALLIFTIDPYFVAATLPEEKKVIFMVLGLNTFIVPTAMILYLKRIKVISSIDVENRRERFIPFAVTLTLYVATYFLLQRTALPSIVLIMLIGTVSAMVLAALITLVWKISIHMTGIGGVVGTLFALSITHQYFPAMILSCAIILAGLIGTARMSMNVHTLGQVIAGFFLGGMTQYLCITLGYAI